jgi:hypothetical protein
MDAIGPRVGMCHCSSCDTFACRWCWAAYRGACPTCRDPFVVPTSVGVAFLARIGATRRRVQRAPLAFTALVASTLVLALTLGGQFRLVGGTQAPSQPGAQAAASFATTPGRVASGEATASATGSARPTGSGTATHTPTGGGAPADDPTPRPTTRVAGETAPPAPTPTPRGPTPPPTPRPAPTPTPRGPTPPPTPVPTPTPAPACESVPTLVGKTLAAARAAWSAAGFTGAFVPAKGHDSMIVVTQNHPAGACLPPGTSIEVTYARP